ncbi:hydrolase [Mycobacterium sp. E802]|nr:hydrolase [Mycobacterium sp. E802]
MDEDARPWWRHRSLGERHRLTLSSGEIAYFDVGAGEPLIFLHGPLMNSNVWRKVVATLAGRYRCICIDLPYGAHQTPMPEADLSFPGLAGLVAETLEALGISAATVIGNDGGTPVAQLLAVTRPDLVARLVLASGGAYDNAPPKRYRPVLKVIAHSPGAQLLMLGPLRIRALRALPFSYGWLTRRPIEPATSDSWALPAIVDGEIFTDLQRMLRSLDSQDVLSAATRFKEFHGQVLVVWSPQDRTFPAAHAERLAADFPNSQLRWIPNSCSLLPEDKPFELAELITQFLKEEVNTHA